MLAPQFTPPLCKAVSGIEDWKTDAGYELLETGEEVTIELQAVHNIQMIGIRIEDVIFFII